MRRVGEVAFSRDIIAEVAEKTGYSKEKVEANYHALVDTIKKMTQEEDVSTIYVPFLGSMYFKPLKFRHYLKNVRDRERSPIPAMEKRTHKLIEDLGPEYHRHLKRSKMSNLFLNRAMKKKQLEEHQNKAYDKLKESKDHS